MSITDGILKPIWLPISQLPRMEIPALNVRQICGQFGELKLAISLNWAPGTATAVGATFQDESGEEKPIVMGSYGIGSGRLLASVVEEYNDQYGLIMPVSIAPYQVHLVELAGKKDESGRVNQAAEQLYQDLQENGLEVLFDDRDESPGVKFNDADLIGVPLRITVGARALNEGGVEIKLRHETEKSLVSLDEVVDRAQEIILSLYEEIKNDLKVVPFE